MSLWENPIKKEYDMLTKGRTNSKEDSIQRNNNENDVIINLEEIMKNNNEIKKTVTYISSPVVARYNGSRADSFNALEMAKVTNKYLDFTISNGNDQMFIH